MSKCTKCNKEKCGCDDQPLFTPGATPVSTSQSCGEYIYTGCVVYNGPELVDIHIAPGMNLNEIIQTLVLQDINPDCISTTCYSPLVYIISTGKTSVDIGWNLVPGAVDYTVSYKDENASPSVWVSLSNSTASHLLITGLTCANIYELKVSANFLSSHCDSLTITITTLNC